MEEIEIKYSKTQQWMSKAMKEMAQQGARWNFGDKDRLFWATALAGEAGEYANLIKKLERGDKINKQELIDELADVASHCYVIALKMDIDLEEAIKQKQRKVMIRSKMAIPENLK